MNSLGLRFTPVYSARNVRPHVRTYLRGIYFIIMRRRFQQNIVWTRLFFAERTPSPPRVPVIHCRARDGGDL